MKKKSKETQEVKPQEQKQPEGVNVKEATDEVKESTDQLHECQKKVTELENSLAEANEKFLRLFSEFDNYRKRTSKERLELSKTATADMITAMLPVLDDLERACTMNKPQAESNHLYEGLLLILNKFKSILRQKGVEEIPAVGEAFNTDLHEAITNIAAVDEKQKGRVIEETQKGYLLHGKVIRYAKVIVAN